MAETFDMTAYLNAGVEQLFKDVVKASLKNPKESLFLQRYYKHHLAMEKRREMLQAEGVSVPTFLIASITNVCNLHCKGCYARANRQCGSTNDQPLLGANRWSELFDQAADMGVPFILLAGGEPMMRRDVLLAAAAREKTIFPIFTNGTLLDETLLKLMDKHRHLVPIVSLEGGSQATDARRGEGAYSAVECALDAMEKKKLLFGVSLTVTTENRAEVMGPAFIDRLYKKGCRVVLFIEYVPVAPGTEALAPDDAQRQMMETAQDTLRERFSGMVFVSFPGDEKHMGGCLAAGRGFFHINAYGGAEPCPFSPYSDISMKDHTLMEAMQSPFFQQVRQLNAADENHTGGCALFEKEAQVKALLFTQGKT